MMDVYILLHTHIKLLLYFCQEEDIKQAGVRAPDQWELLYDR